MISKIKPPPIRILSASFFMLLILVHSQGARAEQQPKFTVETLPADKEPIDSKIWGVGTSIRIVEAMSLPNTCDGIDGEVNFQSYGREISVKLKPKGKDLPTGEGCTQTDTPVVVSVTIPNMPFIPGCMHFIRLETPQRITTDIVRIPW